MDEFQFIESIKPIYYKQPSLIKGVGDDAAVIRNTSEDMVTSVDVFVEGVHFTKQTMRPYHVGYRALAANISDLAAMGALPAFYLVAVTIPKTWHPSEVREVYDGMAELAKMFKMDLIGGDTVSGKSFSLSITVMGYVEKDKARYRSHAKPEDIVFVTGTLGDSQAGLYILQHPEGEYNNKDYFIKRHQMPSPRVSFSQNLHSIKRIALNDISDGIANESREIAKASGVSIVIDEKHLPIHESIQQFPQSLNTKWKLFGGEDFELLGTVAPDEWHHVKQASNNAKVKVTAIGKVIISETKDTVFMRTNHDKIVELESKGYTHLK